MRCTHRGEPAFKNPVQREQNRRDKEAKAEAYRIARLEELHTAEGTKE